MKKSFYLIAVIFILLFGSCESNYYTVELEYCNGKKDTVTVKYFNRPDNSDIITYKEAVPYYHSMDGKRYLNVCNITTLSEAYHK